jgi:formylglycine-generating enzyme required for sulfatase activity
MIKRIIFSALILTIVAAAAVSRPVQEKKKVAVVPTIGTVSDDVKGAVQDALEEGVANSGRYTLVARGTNYEQTLEEFKFQETGAVADNQLKDFGNAVGADFVCYATLRKIGSEYRISYKMIDVATLEVLRASSKSTKNGEKDLLNIINIIAEEMFGGTGQGSAGDNKPGNMENLSVDIETLKVQSIAQTGASVHLNNGLKNGDIYDPDGIELIYVEGSGNAFGIQGFYIGKYEVTQAQYQNVTGINPSGFKAFNNPVENVSWHDTQEFFKKLNAITGRNYRLPTENEWMYAANGGRKNDSFKYAGSNNINDIAWFKSNSDHETHPVGTKAPNSIGIYDMSGNVWEWCLDSYGDDNLLNVARGGCWGDKADKCRITMRGNSSPDTRGSNLGFRVVLTPM